MSGNGFWLLLDAEEIFVPFKQFPWFREASINQLLRVERPASHHLYWPELDIDIAVDSLMHPERYPLVSRVRANRVLERRVPRVTAAVGKPKRKVKASRRGR